MRGLLVDLWRRVIPGSPRIDTVVWFESHSDIPDRLPRHTLALIGGRRDRPKWAALECPCGTAHRIAVPLRRSGGPNWEVSLDANGVPSVKPSVDDQGERRCHFWLRSGRVAWAPNRRRARRATSLSSHSPAGRSPEDGVRVPGVGLSDVTRRSDNRAGRTWADRRALGRRDRLRRVRPNDADSRARQPERPTRAQRRAQERSVLALSQFENGGVNCVWPSAITLPRFIRW